MDGFSGNTYATTDNEMVDCECDGDTPDALGGPDAEMLASASDATATAVAEVDAAIASIVSDASLELTTATADAQLAVAELIGQVDLVIIAALDKIDTFVTQTFNAIKRQFDDIENSLYHAGIIVPYMPSAMAGALDRDPTDMLISAVPGMVPYLSQLLKIPPSLVKPGIFGGTTQTESAYERVGAPSNLPPGVTPPSTWTPDEPIPEPAPAIPVDPVDTLILTPGYPTPVPVPLPPTPVPPTITYTPSGSGDCKPTINITLPPMSVNVMPCSAPVIPESHLPDYSPISTPSPPTAPPPPPVPEPDPSKQPPVSRPPSPIVPTTPLGPPSNPTLTTGAKLKIPPSDTATPVNWDDGEVCRELTNKLRDAAFEREQPKDGPPAAFNDLQSMSVGRAVGNAIADLVPLAETLGIYDKVNFGERAAAYLWDEVIGGKVAKTVADRIGSSGSPNVKFALEQGAKLALVGHAEQKSGFPLSYMYQSELYTYQWANPQYLPDQAGVHASYLANQISASTWQCWTRALGNHTNPQMAVLASLATRPLISELVQLYYKGLIDLPTYRARAREVGVLSDQHASDFVELYKAVPTPVQLIRYMVRDVADSDVVRKYNLDKDFTKKFTGKLPEWALANGVTEDQFRNEWRAHWEIPSNTALFEMFQRLRPDRPAVKAWDKAALDFIAKVSPDNPGDRPAVVTLHDIQEAIEVNDMSPNWVRPLIEIAYSPITRTDATRAYLIGAFSEEQLYEAIRDVGYNDTNAKLLLDYYRIQKAQRQANSTGVWTVRKVVRYYKKSAIDHGEATRLIELTVGSTKQAHSILDAADSELAADNRAKQIATVRQAYLLGEYNDVQAWDALEAVGVPRLSGPNLIEAWKIDRAGKYRSPSVAQILEWVNHELITALDGRTRLQNLGYRQQDAERIIEARIMKGGKDWHLSAEAAGDPFTEAITTVRQARRGSDGTLTKRFNQLIKEAARVGGEINRRRANAGTDPLEPVQVP